MTKHRRTTLYSASQIQWNLLARVTLYWVSCVLFVTIPILLARVWSDPSRLFYEHIPDLWLQYRYVAIPFSLLLPLALCDMLRYSNRVVGPIHRLQSEMTALVAGEDVPQLAFRDGDEWQEMAEAFNRLVTELEETRHAKATGECGDAVDDACQDMQASCS